MTLPGFTATESLYTSTRRYAGRPSPGDRTSGWEIEPAFTLDERISSLGSGLIMPKPDPVREACCKKCWDGGYHICRQEADGNCSCWYE